MLVDESPTYEAFALRLVVALNSLPKLLAVVHVVLDDVLRHLLLGMCMARTWRVTVHGHTLIMVHMHACLESKCMMRYCST